MILCTSASHNGDTNWRVFSGTCVVMMLDISASPAGRRTAASKDLSKESYGAAQTTPLADIGVFSHRGPFAAANPR